jgi:hypothetical protein
MTLRNSSDFGFMKATEFSVTDWLMKKTGILHGTECIRILVGKYFCTGIFYN